MKACLAVLAAAAAVAAGRGVVVPAAEIEAANLYPSWAHHHFVWLNSPESNQANVTKYVADYKAQNITVGGLNVDSLWSTGVDNFIVDTSKFPDMGGMIAGMHSEGVRVIFWVTSMIDNDSSNYQTCIDRQAYVRNALDNTPTDLKWWHGHGLLLDYASAPAKAWWQEQMDQVLALGLDGWKVDGTDPYIAEYVAPRSWNASAGDGGWYTRKEYSDAYYGHFFNHTRQFNGDDGLIWSRPVDSQPLIDWPAGHGANATSTDGVSAFLDFSPKYVMFSGWVGDQDPDFNGLRDALRNVIHSAWWNYTNFGTDTGGYRTGPGTLGRTGELLLRWAGVNAFLPLFENGGDKEHRPWMFDAPGSTAHVDAYRTLVTVHYEIGVYLYALGHSAYGAGVSAITPNQAPEAPFPFILQWNTIHDYSYMLGDAFFIVPVVDEGVTQVRAAFPSGHDVAALPTFQGGDAAAVRSDTTWVSLWDPHQNVPGGTNATVNATFLGIPVYTRANALLPLFVSTPLMGNGDADSASALTLLSHVILSPATAARGLTARCEVRTWKAGGAEGVLVLTPVGPSGTFNATLTLSAWSRVDKDTILLLRGVGPSPATTVVATSGNALRGHPTPSTYTVPRTAPRTFASRFSPPSTPVQARGVRGGDVSVAQGDVATPFIPRGFDPLNPQANAPASAPEPHWFHAPTPASGVPEVFVRAGDAGEGAVITLTHLTLA